MNWDLLEKTTFWIEGAELDGANLDEVAQAASAAMGLSPGQIMVVDVQPASITFDVLKKNIPARSVAGKGEQILKSLSAVRGVSLRRDASIHSEGVLGLIALDPEKAAEVVSRSSQIGREVADAVARRACVFSSGAEVIAGNIEDTNSPYLLQALTRAGFKAEFGGVLEDSLAAATAGLEAALMRGFGLVVTTGGVGAEGKDHNVEAVIELDPHAATAWILKFTPDMKRHHKEGVRIAVGRVGICRIVTLPGPHAEVRLGAGALIDGMAAGLGESDLAESIASVIRERWSKLMGKKHEA